MNPSPPTEPHFPLQQCHITAMWVCNNVHKHQDFDSSYDNQTINTMTYDYLKQTLIIMIILTDDMTTSEAMLCSNCQSSVE